MRAGLRALPRRTLFQQPRKCPRILDSVPFPVVIEIRPDPDRLRFLDPLHPYRKFVGAVVMPIPSLLAMKADVYLGCGHDQLIGKSWSAAGTENDAGLAKGSKDGRVPPTLMAELDDVSVPWVQLRDDAGKPGAGEDELGRQLKEKASHARAEHIGDQAEVFDEFSRPSEQPPVRDEFAHLYRIDEAPAAYLFSPGPDRAGCRPSVERRVQFDGIE